MCIFFSLSIRLYLYIYLYIHLYLYLYLHLKSTIYSHATQFYMFLTKSLLAASVYPIPSQPFPSLSMDGWIDRWRHG